MVSVAEAIEDCRGRIQDINDLGAIYTRPVEHKECNVEYGGAEITKLHPAGNGAEWSHTSDDHWTSTTHDVWNSQASTRNFFADLLNLVEA